MQLRSLLLHFPTEEVLWVLQSFLHFCVPRVPPSFGAVFL